MSSYPSGIFSLVGLNFAISSLICNFAARVLYAILALHSYVSPFYIAPSHFQVTTSPDNSCINLSTSEQPYVQLRCPPSCFIPFPALFLGDTSTQSRVLARQSVFRTCNMINLALVDIPSTDLASFVLRLSASRQSSYLFYRELSDYPVDLNPRILDHTESPGDHGTGANS